MIDRFRRPLLGRDKSHRAAGNGQHQELDPAFYRSLYPDLAHHDDQAAAEHWKRHGQEESRLPNAKAAMLLEPVFDRLPADFNPIGYLFLNRDLGADHFNSTAAIWHYLNFGLLEGRRYLADEIELDFQAAYLRRWPAPSGIDPRVRWVPPSAAHYLYLKGLTDASFLTDFDEEFYAAIALGAGTTLHGRSECIIDFVENGLDRCRPIAEHLRFDVEFYRQRLRSEGVSCAKMGATDLYRRWLSEHDFARYLPNHIEYMKQRFGAACVGDQVVDLGAYRLANTDLKRLDDDRLLEHVFTDGLLERRTSLKIALSNMSVFARYAAKLEYSGEVQKAHSIYDLLTHFLPNQSWLCQQYGDFFYRLKRFADAFRFYDRNIMARTASKWVYLNAAACCVELADLGKSLEVLQVASREYPDDQNILRRERIAADRFFADEYGYAKALAGSGKVEAGQALAFDAATLCDTGVQSVAPGRPVRTVALFANLDLTQCNLYRVEQKSEQLKAAGCAVRVFDWNHDQAAFHDELAEIDAVIFFRVAAFPAIIRAINAARCAGLVVFYETDDLIFDSDHFPEAFADYAGQISQEQYTDICMGVPLFRYALQLCDYAIASTPSLAARMEPLVRCRTAFVHRNALGLRHEASMAAPASPADEARPLRIFYGSGTKAHKLDFERILLPALQVIERRFGEKVRIVIAGHPPIGLENEARFEFVPFTSDTESYWALLRTADICLSVLRRTELTNAKSEIKWLEAAMFGIASVVSATDTFEEILTDGEDGFLAADTNEFVEKISLLIEDPVRRRAMGEAARAKALRDYSVPALATNLRNIFEAVQAPETGRKRVLVVNVYYAPQAKGGATRVVIDNIRDIRTLYPEEFEFEVFTTCEGALNPYSVQVSSHDGVRTTAMVAGEYPDVDMATQDLRAGEIFSRCVKRFDPHLIHFHCIQRITTSAVEVARLLGIPYLITAHDGWWISDRQFLFDADGPAPRYDFRKPAPVRSGPRTRSNRQRDLLLSLEGAKAVLAVSDAFAQIYRDTGLDNVRSVPNGLPPLSSEAVRRTAGQPMSRKGKVCLAHIGGLERHKGFGMLKLAVLAVNPRNVSIMAVDLALDPGEERLDQWGETPVRITARRKQSEMAALYAEIDVLFAPSLWPESFGLVTREALAAGCWVVASDRGAVGEPVEEGLNGYVVSVDDLTGLIEVVRRIDADPARYLAPPPPGRPMRTSEDQARDLADIYREMSA